MGHLFRVALPLCLVGCAFLDAPRARPPSAASVLAPPVVASPEPKEDVVVLNFRALWDEWARLRADSRVTRSLSADPATATRLLRLEKQMDDHLRVSRQAKERANQIRQIQSAAIVIQDRLLLMQLFSTYGDPGVVDRDGLREFSLAGDVLIDLLVLYREAADRGPEKAEAKK